jgi:hypothetical protein
MRRTEIHDDMAMHKGAALKELSQKKPVSRR